VKRPGVSRWLYLGLFLAYLAHNDFWLGGTPGWVFGLPSVLFYHLLFCLGTSVLMWLLVDYAWPAELEVVDSEDAEP
jgi:hypothetical protein